MSNSKSMARSRVNQRLARQTERNLIFILLGIGVIVVLFLIFGANLLVKFSLFVERKADSSSVQAQNSSFVSIPSLDPLVSSTNSATIDVSGTADNGSYIKLYVNGKMAKKADIKSDHTFIAHDVQLEAGENDIKAKTFLEEEKKQSEFSDIVSVRYSNKAPELSIDFPSDGQIYNKDNNPIRVRGKAGASSRVTVNDFWAITDNEGNYIYNLPLKNDDNEIKVVATDDAGNKAEKTIHITYHE